MTKNIVVCCDGTGNEYGDRNSNVLKLYSILPKNDSRQVTFYDPGVGTLTLPPALSKPARQISRMLGLAFGRGITANITDAYRFLMRTYEPGDKVFFFGFSRGAYTARAAAAMLYKCGLLDARNDNLLPYALNVFKHERRKRIYGGFRRTFSRPCPVHFLGLWDTVKSLGWIYDPMTLPFTMRNPGVRAVRHAVSVDERRCFYRPNLWGPPDAGQDVKQVWFAGSHSDVGGSLPEKESGLSQIALQWMLAEAEHFELRLDRKRREAVLPPRAADYRPDDEDPECEYHHPPDFRGPIHDSLRGFWWIPEFLPRMYQDPREEYRKKIMIPLGRRRWIPEGSILHESVLLRMGDPTLGYRPPNLPKRYSIEPFQG